MCKTNVRTSLVVSRLQQGCNQTTGIMDSKNLILNLPGNLPENRSTVGLGKNLKILRCKDEFYFLRKNTHRSLFTSDKTEPKRALKLLWMVVIVLLTSSKSNFRFLGFFSSLCWDFCVMVYRLNVSYFIINLWQTSIITFHYNFWNYQF